MRRKVLGVLILAAVASLTASARGSSKPSKTFTVDQAASLKGTNLSPGSYKVSWETHSSEATVTVASTKDGKVVATVPAKIVDRGVKYDRNAVVYDEGANGSRVISEIRLAGTTEALVFSD